MSSMNKFPRSAVYSVEKVILENEKFHQMTHGEGGLKRAKKVSLLYMASYNNCPILQSLTTTACLPTPSTSSSWPSGGPNTGVTPRPAPTPTSRTPFSAPWPSSRSWSELWPLFSAVWQSSSELVHHLCILDLHLLNLTCWSGFRLELVFAWTKNDVVNARWKRLLQLSFMEGWTWSSCFTPLSMSSVWKIV